jgi:hypothetical protein
LETGWEAFQDTQRNKAVSYLTTHFKRTEEGFDTRFGPLRPSACKISTRWGWHTSAAGNRWSKAFQAYRPSRFYVPQNTGDSYDTGQSIVTTKNKIRGSGPALSIYFSTEPEKDCHIYGWAMSVTGSTYV